ncbi:MAG TPA: hypothetical protein ENI31_03120 [Candidatus Omnitrophica bacterium]|nr:hypothetical protein [Candidatus Omnitrophota bacterium]
MNYRKSQSILSWTLVIGTVATVILFTSPIFRRILAKRIKQVSNLAIWTEEGPTQWTENVFNGEGEVIGSRDYQGSIALHYKGDETEAEENTDTYSRVIHHEHKGVISNYVQGADTQQVVKTSSTQRSVGDGFEDWLE